MSTDTPIAENGIELQIAAKEAEIKSLRSRLAIFYFNGAFVLLGIAFAVAGRTLIADIFGPESSIYRNAPLVGIGLAVYCLFIGGYFGVMRQSRLAAMQQELDVLNAKKRVFMHPSVTAGAAPASYFDRLVDINVSNLEAYYGLVRVHTNNSFQIAIFAGMIGFLLVVSGIIVGFTGATRAESLSYITTAAGVITEFIAGVFFYLYNRTVRQLKEYHDSLIRVQNILLSFKIAGDTPDGNQKNILFELMMRCLIAGEDNPRPSPAPQTAKTPGA